MDKVSGLDILKYLKNEQNSFKDVPVIITSTWATEKDKEEAFRAGASAYLIKPFEHKELLEIINSHYQN